MDSLSPVRDSILYTCIASYRQSQREGPSLAGKA